MIYDTVRDRLVRVVLVDEHQAKCVSNPDLLLLLEKKYQRIEGLKHKAEIFADRLTDVKK